MARQIAILTCQEINELSVLDDHKIIPFLDEHNIETKTIIWNRGNENWSQFDAVIVRSTWDYQDHYTEFLETLQKIDEQTRLLNDFELMKWNSDKSYLAELDREGFRPIPSVFFDNIDQVHWFEVSEKFDQSELIIKPQVGAGGQGLFRLQPQSSIPDEVNRLYQVQPGMIQPLIADIKELGEISLMFFNGQFSHAIKKTPRGDEIRCQEEFGGIIKSHSPTSEHLDYCDRLHQYLPTLPLYSRVDILPQKNGSFLLGELELIEPALYLTYGPQSGEMLANAIRERLDNE